MIIGTAIRCIPCWQRAFRSPRFVRSAEGSFRCCTCRQPVPKQPRAALPLAVRDTPPGQEDRAPAARKTNMLALLLVVPATGRAGALEVVLLAAGTTVTVAMKPPS